ncbi:hypothetical protein Acr_00g0061950 [Actinidia rufa]|uniref:At5g58720/SDE5-like UBA-like domain-containing protein n=1 Tax=Actinidia rufa TaxID=165716 RepID=A0A7J0DQN8_9ERIC|nr:hypothetical protein Acr_00g0061950 [Actinidia rufa]
MKHSKKKKRSRRPNQVVVKGSDHGQESEEQRSLKSLKEALTSVSLEKAASAYREANGVLNKAAEIIGGLEEIPEDQATSCSSSSGTARLSSSSGSSSVEVFMEPNCGQIGVHGKGFRGNKQKKVVAATGTVSSFLGKDYVTPSIRKDSSKRKGYAHVPASKEDAEQFLCSLLGDNCELSMAVVRDVLGEFSIKKNIIICLDTPLASSVFIMVACDVKFGTKKV